MYTQMYYVYCVYIHECIDNVTLQNHLHGIKHALRFP